MSPETAIRQDALSRLEQLIQARHRLQRDADDALVLSELVAIDSEIRAAQQALKDGQP